MTGTLLIVPAVVEGVAVAGCATPLVANTITTIPTLMCTRRPLQQTLRHMRAVLLGSGSPCYTAPRLPLPSISSSCSHHIGTALQSTTVGSTRTVVVVAEAHLPLEVAALRPR